VNKLPLEFSGVEFGMAIFAFLGESGDAIEV
jgi:hypothetical protein